MCCVYLLFFCNFQMLCFENILFNDRTAPLNLAKLCILSFTITIILFSEVYEMKMNIIGWRWVILEKQGRSTDENYIREQHIHEKFIKWQNPNYIFEKTTLFHLIFSIHPQICTGTDKTFDLFICWKN